MSCRYDSTSEVNEVMCVSAAVVLSMFCPSPLEFDPKDVNVVINVVCFNKGVNETKSSPIG